MRRIAGLLGVALIGMAAIATVAEVTVAEVTAAEAPKGITNLPLIFSDDFESGSAEHWSPTDPAAWKITKTDAGTVYSQFAKSNTKTPVRSPFNRSMIKDVTVSDFVLDVKLQSTVKDYDHRDMCLFFGYQDPAHLYYVHLGKKTDDHANQIFIVNNADRKKISTKTSSGTNWTDDWHHARLVRDVKSGSIKVFFDNMNESIMEATDSTFTWGQVGVGTFDDTGNFDDAFLFGTKVSPPSEVAATGSQAQSETKKADRPDNTPPEGFSALFNGKDLTGWKGLVKDIKQRMTMTPEQIAEEQKKADELMNAHWRVEKGVLMYDGKGQSLSTAKDYGDFELYCDWKIEPKGDSGIYLRGTPQVQIWDPSDEAQLKNGADKGSGSLWNNKKNPRFPDVKADNPIGQWNTFFIRMVGDKVTITLNGKTVVNNVTLENYWEPDKPCYETGPIELQHHGNTLYFKNIYVRKLPKK